MPWSQLPKEGLDADRVGPGKRKKNSSRPNIKLSLNSSFWTHQFLIFSFARSTVDIQHFLKTVDPWKRKGNQRCELRAGNYFLPVPALNPRAFKEGVDLRYLTWERFFFFWETKDGEGERVLPLKEVIFLRNVFFFQRFTSTSQFLHEGALEREDGTFIS